MKRFPKSASPMNPEFLSGEASASPAVEPMMEGARRLAALGYGGGYLAARNGPRVTTHASVPFELLTPADFVEVADYDPHLDRLLMIGQRPAHAHAGLLQLIFRAKKEVGALVMVADPLAASRELLVAAKGRTTLENALAILEALRGSDVVAWNGHVVAVAPSVPKAFAAAEAALR